MSIDEQLAPTQASPAQRGGERALHLASPIAAGIVAVVAGVHLVAWLAGVMGALGNAAITMKANAALSLLLLAVSLILLGADTGTGSARRWTARLCAGLALTIGALTLFENISGWNLHIDEFIAVGPPADRGATAANRMGSPASASIALIGLALLHLSRRTPGRNPVVVQGMAAAACLMGMLPTLGYLYGAHALYGVTRVSAIALPTALSIIALGVGVLLARPTGGLVAQLGAADAAATVVRRLLLPVWMLPVALGWLQIAAIRLGIFDPAMGTAVLVLTFVASLSVLIGRAGRRGSKAESEKRRAENALRESEAQYRVLFASNPSPMIVFDDDTLRIVAVNDAAVRHYGWTREEFLDLTVLDLRPPEERDLARIEVVDPSARIQGAGMGTVRHRRKDGTVIDLELSASAIRFSGRPARLCSMNDVTVRRQAEEVLRRYELVVQESRDILLFIRRSDGKILQANPAATRAYGYAHDELLSMTVQDLRAPETRSVVESQMSDADSRGVLFETTHERKDGTTFPAEVSSRGAVIGGVRVLISVVRDITQRKRVELALREANERLRETDERKNEFLAVLSHELRNPLAPIRNGLHVLEQAAPGSEAARRAQEVIARQTRQLARLVDDVLDVVRVSRNKIRLRVTSLDLNELVARTVQDHRSLFEERHITLDATFCAERLAMSGDEARLAQVVGNLLQNAAKFTLPGGHVSVRTLLQAGGSRATLHVVDTGVGIDPATIPQLFEPFMQVETALDRSKGGLGIGLSLVKSLVEMHGGRVRAESDGPDRGAEFVVEFPLEPVATPADVVQGPLAAQRTRRVLIIEDNPDAADTLETMLELGGHVVRVARDGPEGLALAREFRPEVVLCDIGLPGMDGFEVARTFRADAVLSETHLVAVSGYARQEDVQRARDAGFDRHLAKPASPESIQHLLNEHRPSRATRGDMANLH